MHTHVYTDACHIHAHIHLYTSVYVDTHIMYIQFIVSGMCIAYCVALCVCRGDLFRRVVVCIKERRVCWKTESNKQTKKQTNQQTTNGKAPAEQYTSSVLVRIDVLQNSI